jgi:thiamine kinase-like enzyme
MDLPQAGSSVTVEEAIACIPSWTKATAVAISPLPGGITNFNYRVEVDGEAFHVRIWAGHTESLGIDRHREYQCAMAASRTGVAPEVVHFLPDVGVMVTRFVSGRAMAPGDVVDPETAQRVVRSMRRYHEGPAFAETYSPFEAVAAYLRAVRHSGGQLPDDIDEIDARVREIDRALRRGSAITRPCHNDLWGPNLIDDGQQIRIVDWEYAGTGDIVFDLANFAIYHMASDAQNEMLLRTYFGKVSERKFARLKLLKIIAQYREALWYLVALKVSADPTGFVDQAQAHFARCRQALADRRVQSWLRVT